MLLPLLLPLWLLPLLMTPPSSVQGWSRSKASFTKSGTYGQEVLTNSSTMTVCKAANNMQRAEGKQGFLLRHEAQPDTKNIVRCQTTIGVVSHKPGFYAGSLRPPAAPTEAKTLLF